jgi:hypothetical protein
MIDYDDVIGGGRGTHDAYERVMWGAADTPVKLLAAHIAQNARVSPPSREDQVWPYYASTYWWSRTRGRLRVGGRDPYEARLRLRDDLIKLAEKECQEAPTKETV